MKSSKIFAAVLIGAAAGAILGVLFAPDSGAETRKKIKKKSKEMGDKLTSQINDFGDQISEKINAVRDEANEILNQKG